MQYVILLLVSLCADAGLCHWSLMFILLLSLSVHFFSRLLSPMIVVVKIRARELAAARERRKVKYLQIMQNGMELLKFNFESNSKPHKRFFKVSADGHSLEVCSLHSMAAPFLGGVRV